MEKKLSGEPLNTHCELVALRLMVEAMFEVMPVAQQDAMREAFEERCEGMRATLLGGPHREELLQAMNRALDLQLAGIGARPSPLPPGVLG